MRPDKITPPRKCFIPGCDQPAPYGYRRSGPIQSLPEGKRGYLWACRDHMGEAEDRKAKAETTGGRSARNEGTA